MDTFFICAHDFVYPYGYTSRVNYDIVDEKHHTQGE